MEHATTLDAQPGLNAYNLRSDIGERRRPLSAYQLLGLTAKEGDTDAILTAVALKRRDLVARRGEVSLEDWNQIYREVDEAASMLLNPGAKRPTTQTCKCRKILTCRCTPPVRPLRADNVLDCTRCKTRNPSTRKFCAPVRRPALGALRSLRQHLPHRRAILRRLRRQPHCRRPPANRRV